jgi:signal transduction histidine kinase
MTAQTIADAVFGLLFDSGAEAAFIVDRTTGQIVAANVCMSDMLAVDHGVLIGYRLQDLLYENLDRDITAPGQYEEVALRRSDDYPVFVSLNVTHVDHPDWGSLAACLARDTTERRSLERELVAKHSALFAAHADLERAYAALREAKQQLEQRNREITMLAGEVSRFGRRAAIGELVAGIAHHLNNPVGALTSTMRRIASKVADLPASDARVELERLLGRGHDITTRIESNVNAILRAHASGDVDNTPRWLELGHELETAISMFSDRLTGIEVVRHLGEANRVLVPQDSLHHVVSNLIDNGLRAMRDHGTLTVSVQGRPDAVAIRIADTGGGVEAEVRPKLFDPILSARPGGSGLGLSTAQRLARSWGGDVSYVPIPGGSVFEVLIPSKEAS